MSMNRRVEQIYDDETGELISTVTIFEGEILFELNGGESIVVTLAGDTKLDKSVPVGKTLKGRIYFKGRLE